MADTPNSGIPYVPENVQDPAAGLNLSLNVIDALLGTFVLDMSISAPPAAPPDGSLYIVGPTATGTWLGKENHLARYVAEGTYWQFFEPGAQVRFVFNTVDGALYVWHLDSWQALASV